jgi:uncharacterized membrane protein
MKSRLLNDLPELLEHNIISNAIASDITAYYQSKTEGQSSRLFTIFGVLGSALVGLGIILILAHNWDNFSKLAKTVMAFLPLILGQVASGYSILKKKGIVWKESSGTFLFFAIGATIALISQIYNIPGDLSRYLLTWIVLGLPLIYVLKSKSVMLLIIVFATYYACELGYKFGYGGKAPWLYPLILLVTIPFYAHALQKKAKTNSTAIFNWLYAISITIVLGTFINSNWSLGFLMYAMLFSLFYNLGQVPVFNSYQLRRNSFLLLGLLGTVLLLLILSFNTIWKEMTNDHIVFNSLEMLIGIILFISASAVMLYSRKYKRNSKFNPFQYVFILIAVLFVVGYSNYGLGAIFTNVILFLLGLAAIKIGVNSFRFSILNYGLLIITALIVCRFFDTNMSFVLRGLLFLSIGLGFFLTNFFMFKKQNELNRKILK